MRGLRTDPGSRAADFGRTFRALRKLGRRTAKIEDELRLPSARFTENGRVMGSDSVGLFPNLDGMYCPNRSQAA